MAKGGSTNLVGVYWYGEPATTKGFAFVDSPGYDPCSITGEVASGGNLACFTAGRGSCYANKPAPSIRPATNTVMDEHMVDDMDINCGTIGNRRRGFRVRTLADPGPDVGVGALGFRWATT